MSELDKPAQRDNLIMLLGRLLAPLEAMSTVSPPPTFIEYRIQYSLFERALGEWEKEVIAFATLNGVLIEVSYREIVDIVRGIRNHLRELGQNREGGPNEAQRLLFGHLHKFPGRVITAINRVPLEWPARLINQSPLTAALHIRDAISTAATRVHFFDRYLQEDVFPLYLRSLARNIEVKLITTSGKTTFGVQNLLPMAKLAGKEFASFALVECDPAKFHQRNLRVDDKVFEIGASLSEVGTYPTTFALVDSSPAAHAAFDAIIAASKVVV